MTITLWCAPGVYAAAVDEDLIVLNIEDDRYDCLIGAGELLELGSSGQINVQDDAVAEALRRTGVGVDQQPRPPRPASIPALQEASALAYASRSEILRAFLILATASAVFRGKSLSELVRFGLPMRPSRSLGLGENDLHALLAAARRARPWVPFEGECLQRTFLLRYFLARSGVATDWVFGVRTWPFAAHCWLQIGDLVVGDRLERVQRFTPIMKG